jgi:hypothetical protein
MVILFVSSLNLAEFLLLQQYTPEFDPSNSVICCFRPTFYLNCFVEKIANDSKEGEDFESNFSTDYFSVETKSITLDGKDISVCLWGQTPKMQESDDLEFKAFKCDLLLKHPGT